MVQYSCRRCGLDTKIRTHFKRHIYRKHACKPIIEDIDIKIIQEEFENLKNEKKGQKKDIFGHLVDKKCPLKIYAKCFTCDFCNNAYKTEQTKKRHMKKYCRAKKSVIQMEKMKKLAKENEELKEQLNKSSLENSFISLNVNEFSNNIKKINAKNETVTVNQISNMANINKSLIIAKDQCNDLIYFVEDGYINNDDAISEMIFSYERISSQLNNELILCPTDYPYLYTKLDSTNIFLGSNIHWRKIDESLCTFLTSKFILDKYWKDFVAMCKYEHYPFEQPLHNIYKVECCLSPLPSLAIHLTNINSIFGLSPNVDWKKVWDKNEDY